MGKTVVVDILLLTLIAFLGDVSSGEIKKRISILQG
jgi:hypothetical protein